MQFLGLARKIYSYLNLEAELEQGDVVYQEINRSVVFKGTNLWILMFAIIVASVGLNMNSTAVIIGAMLISPLMGPINGMGYAVATYDLDLFRRALKNFGFAISAGLVASTVYFMISPVSTAHSELLARTSPTIYDVVIALFGGLAGIVAIASKQKGNVIPGVAIATALMPPLCTAGYGIATAQLDFFLGALYLFAINTIFIALAAVWISKILRFPIRTIVDPVKKKQINQAITAVIIIVLLPSLYFGYRLVLNEHFLVKSKEFVIANTRFEGNYLLHHEIDADSRTIRLDYLGEPIAENRKSDLEQSAKRIIHEDVILEINQGIDLDDFEDERTEIYALREEVQSYKDQLREKKQELYDLKNYGSQGAQLLEELRILEPKILNLAFGSGVLHAGDSSSSKEINAITLFVKGEMDATTAKRVEDWLQKRVQGKALIVNFKTIEAN